MQDILILINERAGGLSAATVENALLQELAVFPLRQQQRIEIIVTRDIPHLREAIASRQSHLSRVVAAGGDGTVTEVIAVLLSYPHLQLGIMPVGTGNRLAANLGIPLHLRGALETVLNGVPHPIDIGRINDRYFSLMAGVGLDAEIMAEVQPLEKRTMGVLAYFWRGFQHAFFTPYAIFDIVADGQHIRCRGIGVVVANAGNLLGRYFTLTPGAQPDDGLLDVCVLASRHRTDYWTTIIQVLSQQHRGVAREGVRHLRARHITIKSRPVVKAQADGDVIGTTPIDIQTLPGAVSVLVPPPHKLGHPISESLQNLGDHLRLVIRDLLGKPPLGLFQNKQNTPDDAGVFQGS